MCTLAQGGNGNRVRGPDGGDPSRSISAEGMLQKVGSLVKEENLGI
jgi:hypothetical protein